MRYKLIVGAAGILWLASVQAQDTSGNIVGDGRAGDTVTVDSSNIGFHREMTLEKDGRYQMRHVPIGDYVVSLRHADGTAEPTKVIRVQTGATARVR